MQNTPMVTDWIMVIITIVYAITTIGIFRANKKTVEVSKEQFKETTRLSYMPFLQLWDACGEIPVASTVLHACETDAEDDYINFVAKLKNIGNGTAVNLVYDWKCTEIGVSEIDCVPINAIAAGDSYLWQLTFAVKSGSADNLHPILTFSYNDILGYTYEQRVFVTFDENNSDLGYVHCDTDEPVFKGIVTYYKLAGKK
jgi:hypothetical protein